MNIKILGAESLGVRGLSCSVELNGRKIFIDPGVALGWSRHGLLPHPFQIAVGAVVKRRIVAELKDADDVIISHFDGDHCPLLNPNPYQLGIEQVKGSLSDCRIWSKGPNDSSPNQQRRRRELAEAMGRELKNAEGIRDEPFEFSLPVPHGQQAEQERTVMMTKIVAEGLVFVHASDIQLLDRQTTEKIVDWKPDIVLASGPPFYRHSPSSFHTQREQARENAMKLSSNVETLIIDHHLLRDEEGIMWLQELKDAAGSNVFCAADFMQRDPIFLEAWRRELYEWLPVPEHWHEDYKQGIVDTGDYRIRGWEVLIENGRLHPCKWYYCCPIKKFTEEDKLDRRWVENYCLVNNRSCVRYWMEEEGKRHPDNMLPNGKIKEDM